MVATSDAVWSEQGTTPDAIEAALRRLLIERHAENERFVPARVLNMIAFVDRAWSGEIANRLRGVGRYHASRLLVFSYEPQRERLDARVMIASEGQGDDGELALLRETVVVEVGDRHLDDLLTIADPLVVTDLPTLLWSPHGHHEIVQQLLAMSQAVLLDSVEEPVVREALDRAGALSAQVYVVDLAWLRSTPWRERVAAAFDPPALRLELSQITGVSVRHHPASTVAALLLVGWLASRLGWQTWSLGVDGAAQVGRARSGDFDIGVRLEMARELQVPGLQSVELRTASGLDLSLTRGTGGLRARARDGGGHIREWTIPGASRGEAGVLGEGIRQALLRDPTYVPALERARAMLPSATTRS
ncbi:MAG TPA: glucose-6-phosphate dehydrogenase assembly protein OpcA [Solirubrobacteraceae bacterium]|nr:glucose-6-phosphate dehydrogenase assembly protein OpcA [Solirubrobacteraceae bacterium]